MVAAQVVVAQVVVAQVEVAQVEVDRVAETVVVDAPTAQVERAEETKEGPAVVVPRGVVLRVVGRPREVAVAHKQTRGSRSGFTLMELMLAVALSGFIMLAIGMAIDLHLRMLDERRGEIEQAQLARAVLGLMSQDLRNAVRYQEVDTSAVGESFGGEALDDLDPEMMGDNEDLSAAAMEAGVDPDAVTGEPMDIATTTTPPTIVGVYGNSYQLQVDVSRLPRIDQYDRMLSPDAGVKMQDIPSDVKTVAYYLAPDASMIDDPTVDMTTSVEVPTSGGVGYGRGLVRRELDRSVTNWAIETGDTQRLQNSGEVIAPEVVGLQFRYYDGVEWLLEWDTETMERLPIAVEITILVDSLDGTPITDLTLDNPMMDPNSTSFYRLIVPILVAELPTDEEQELEEELGF